MLPPESETVKTLFMQGHVLAYPTEAVFGLGCDPFNPDALDKILKLKNRPVEKGVILVADVWERVSCFVDIESVPESLLELVKSSWPGFVTWLMPKSKIAPDWICGDSDLIAIRVSAHPVIQQLCSKLQSALVSTSANLSGEEAITERFILEQVFSQDVVYIAGELGGEEKPSMIRHALTGKIIRGN